MFPSSRRDFLKQTALAATAVAVAPHSTIAVNKPGDPPSKNVPWYRRTLRWGQTNITEIDPERYDIAWWRQYWKRTETQGVIINAGGIVAYYPTKFPLHHQAEYLNGRDLFGELCRAAHEDGLMVFARMDSNRAHEDLYRAHPDWFAWKATANPTKPTIFSLPASTVLTTRNIFRPSCAKSSSAIIRKDSRTTVGLVSAATACVFATIARSISRNERDSAIPEEKNWNDPIYREWIRWNYERRLEIWDLNNRITRTAGGRDCIWVGMNGGSIAGQAQSFRDYRQICQRADMIMLDYQARGDGDGFQQNGEAGKLIHGLLGWDKLIPESMAMYQMGKPLFRFASKPEPEARLWMLDGIAGGLQPWWHQVAAYHEDRRRYKIPEPILQWHRANESYLYNRRPIATVGVVWSQQNLDFYGRDDGGVLVELPWRGVTQALVRARIPFLPVHADDLERDAANFSALVLPNLAAMSDSQVTAVRRFVEKGGGLLATGQSSRFNESGETQSDFALADLFGAHISQNVPLDDESRRRKWATETVHTYLRLSPELRARVDGPHIKGEPLAIGKRHPVLQGFNETDILPYGGMLDSLRLDDGTEVLLTFIPASPTFPPEKVWMREPKTDIPGLILNARPNQGRVAFLPADLDRRFARDNLPDHGNLLANLVRWTAADNLPLVVDGHGLMDCHLYSQPGRMILHLMNLTNPGAWRQPVDELIPVGPLQVRVKLEPDVRGKNVKFLVAGQKHSTTVKNGWSHFQINSILDHEVVILT